MIVACRPQAAVLASLVALAVSAAVAGRADDTLRSSAPARLSIAYLLRIENVPGMRGVADSIDRVRAGRLDDANPPALYFRLGDQAWIMHDDTTIAEVRRALDDQDLAEHRLRYAQGQPGLEEERRALQRRRRDLERRRLDLEAQRASLPARFDGARKPGETSRGLMSRRATLDHQIAGLRAEEQEIARSEALLRRRADEALHGDAAARVQRDRVRQQAMETIVAAARRAIERGRARPFAP
jgi:hypothetical protein